MFDLKKFRKEQDITQKDLAEILKVDQSFISQVENGKDSMPDAWLSLISIAYKDVDINKYITEGLPSYKPPASNNEERLWALIESQQRTIADQQKSIGDLTEVVKKIVVQGEGGAAYVGATG